MGVKVKEKESDSIHVSELQDGQIAIITEWACTGCNGRIVQRFKEYLLEIGGRSGECWHFGSICSVPCNKVRILKPGTILEIVR